MFSSILGILSSGLGVLDKGMGALSKLLDRLAAKEKTAKDEATGAMKQREEIRAEEQEQSDAARKQAAKPKTIDAAIDQLVASERVRDD